MNPGKAPKLVFAALALILMVPVHFLQRTLNRDRTALGLTRVAPLENAPPMLAFTTVALGSFRGLIANALWVRAVDLQDKGKYFEMIQLADWITKLQPTFTSVWIHQAWNLSYNISIKFRDPAERWHWVLSGIQLLRDRGLRYNPKETLLYRELAWHFQHKIGQYLDDAHIFYKQAWAGEVAKVFGPGKPNYLELIDPQTEEQKTRAARLREELKMDPRLMKEVDDTYGPLEWRLPETHAIYWAMAGLKLAKKEDLITLRRVVYQAMDLACKRGRLIENTFDGTFEFGPNLAIVDKANQAYEDMMAQDPDSRENIKIGHRNFLRDIVYFLYTHNRLAEAGRWFKVLQEKYPEKPLLTGFENSAVGTMTLSEYAVSRIAEDIGETSQDRIKAILEGLFKKSYYNLAIGEDDQCAGYAQLAQDVWQRYQASIPDDQKKRVGLPSLPVLRKAVLDELLNPPPDIASPVLQMVAQLRVRLGLPATTTNVPLGTELPATTNAPTTPTPAAK